MINQETLHYLQDSVFGWYQQAETKAQILLGATGVILGILLQSAFFSDSAFGQSKLTTAESVILLAVLACYVVTIVLLVYALWSRGVFRDSGKGFAFFVSVTNYRTPQDLGEALSSEGAQEEYLQQLVKGLLALSDNTKKKHRAINVAAIFLGLGLFGTVLLGFSLIA
jgi:hypothetical protein